MYIIPFNANNGNQFGLDVTPVELEFLYTQAKNMESIVELGSWRGRSSHALASGCKGTLWCVDHWKGSLGTVLVKQAEKEDIYSIFLENLKEFTNIIPLKMNTDDALKYFEDGSVDMVFIDAGHNYAEIKNDINNWYPKVKKLICGHDYQKPYPGVIRAVNEQFGKADELVGTIWVKWL